ncbi:MAG: YHS domain-containing (seleno)protein [Chlamydiota bacterium]
MLWNKICLMSLMIFACTFTLFAGDDLKHYMLKDDNNNALKGLDVVSFFEGTPAQGSQDFQTEYAEVNWSFANQANLDKFIQSPSEYLPKYHGYCAWAIMNDRLREGMIDYWHVYDDDLYFLCSEEAMKNFQDDPEGISEKADEKWQEMLHRS